jgi:hypothetical protein
VLPVAVIDTNILISYLFGGRTISTLIDAVEQDRFVPAISSWLIDEFKNTVRKPKIARKVQITDALAFINAWADFAVFVKPRNIVTVCRDPNDNQILACALGAAADFIITGDKDLLVIEEFHGTRIVTPATFVANVLNIPLP